MRTGRLAIAKGYQLAASAEPAPPLLALVPEADAPAAPAPNSGPAESPDLHKVQDRLSALERLTRLYEQGVLSADEFLDEKALILGRRIEEKGPVGFSPAQPRRPVPGPSLIGRMLNWKFLLLSLVIGLGFSFVTQPDATLRAFDQAVRYFGA
jgi:hypothetical protein